MSRLSPQERETILGFNEGEPTGWIFTYNKMWQKHLEGKLGLKPVKDNGEGGREYEIDKKRISMPRALKKVKLSPEQRKAIGERLQKARLSSKTIATTIKSAKRK